MKQWTLDSKAYLDIKEVKKVMAWAEAHAQKSAKRGGYQAEVSWLALRLGLEAGLRANEIATLRKDDLDLRRLDEARLHVRKGKRGSNGVIFVPKSLAAHLRCYLKEVRPKLKPRKDHGNLLLGREGKPLTRLTMNKRMRTLLRAAGLPEGRLNELSPVHCLRHTCGVMLYRATKNLRLVQKQLRHTRSTTTEVYANLLDEDWRAGVEAAFTEPSDVGLRLSGS